MIHTSSVTLTDALLVKLDGCGDDSVQQKVDDAKARIAMADSVPELTAEQAAFVADIVSLATRVGKLQFRSHELRVCRCCGKRGGHYAYTRNTRHHKKGEPNYDRPRYLDGVDLKVSSVIMRGHATYGCCCECFAAVRDVLVKQLASVRAEIPEAIMGAPPRYKAYRRRKCPECAWEGHEGEMGRLRTIMWDGSYPGQCPKCGYRNEFLSRGFEFRDGYDVVEAGSA